MESKPDAFVKEEFMRCLDHDPGSVSCVAFTAAGTPVFHIFEYGECVRNDLMAFIALYIGDKADATGIPLKRRMI